MTIQNTNYGDKTFLLINEKNLENTYQADFFSWLDGRARTAPDIALNISEDDLDTIINEELVN